MLAFSGYTPGVLYYSRWRKSRAQELDFLLSNFVALKHDILHVKTTTGHYCSCTATQICHFQNQIPSEASKNLRTRNRPMLTWPKRKVTKLYRQKFWDIDTPQPSVQSYRNNFQTWLHSLWWSMHALHYNHQRFVNLSSSLFCFILGQTGYCTKSSENKFYAKISICTVFPHLEVWVLGEFLNELQWDLCSRYRKKMKTCNQFHNMACGYSSTKIAVQSLLNNNLRE